MSLKCVFTTDSQTRRLTQCSSSTNSSINHSQINKNDPSLTGQQAHPSPNKWQRASRSFFLAFTPSSRLVRNPTSFWRKVCFCWKVVVVVCFEADKYVTYFSILPFHSTDATGKMKGLYRGSMTSLSSQGQRTAAWPTCQHLMSHDVTKQGTTINKFHSYARTRTHTHPSATGSLTA